MSTPRDWFGYCGCPILSFLKALDFDFSSFDETGGTGIEDEISSPALEVSKGGAFDLILTEAIEPSERCGKTKSIFTLNTKS